MSKGFTLNIYVFNWANFLQSNKSGYIAPSLTKRSYFSNEDPLPRTTPFVD